MNRTYDNISIDIEDDHIACQYTDSVSFRHSWKISLLKNKVIFINGNSETSFLITDIKEFQFEVDSSGKYGLFERASAYVILKDDPDPKEFYSLTVSQPVFALTTKTRAYDFCRQILSSVSDKYAIPFSYKISIETKAKTNRIGLIFLVLILLVIMLALMFRTGK